MCIRQPSKPSTVHERGCRVTDGKQNRGSRPGFCSVEDCPHHLRHGPVLRGSTVQDIKVSTSDYVCRELWIMEDFIPMRFGGIVCKHVNKMKKLRSYFGSNTGIIGSKTI